MKTKTMRERQKIRNLTGVRPTQLCCIDTHIKKRFCIISVPQVPEPLHTNAKEIHKNNIPASFIAHENHILHGVPSYRHPSMKEDMLLGIRGTGVYCNVDHNF